MKLLASIGLAILVFVSGASETKAGGISLNVAPPIFEWVMNRGELRPDKIKIYNLSETPLPISIKISDFTIKDEAGVLVFDELGEDASFSAKKWINFENANFILQPGETRSLPFTVEVPENAEPGGHYAIIIFEPALPSFYFKEGAVRAVPELGVLFLFSIPTFSLESSEVQLRKIEVAGFAPSDESRIKFIEGGLTFISSKIFGEKAIASKFFVIEKAPSKFLLRIKNNDVLHHKASGKLLIYNTFGKLVEEINVPSLTILPQKIRQIPMELKQEIPAILRWLPASIGKFLVENSFWGRYKVEYRSAEGVSVYQAKVWALPWKTLVPALFMLGLVIIFRRRIVAAAEVLNPKSKIQNPK